jgi:hypothetical protein
MSLKRGRWPRFFSAENPGFFRPKTLGFFGLFLGVIFLAAYSSLQWPASSRRLPASGLPGQAPETGASGQFPPLAPGAYLKSPT